MSRRALVATWCVAVGIAGVATLAITLLLGGGAPPPAPPGLSDDGRLPAWLSAIASYISLVLGVATVGVGLLGSGALDHSRPRLRSAAVASAVSWAAFTVLQIGLLSWELRGRSELADSTRFRALLLQLMLALLCAVAWKLGGRRAIEVAAVGVALAALLPVVIAGHPQSADDPVIAGIAVSAHAVSAALWVGGLAAIAWLAANRTGDWTEALPRYSQLALGCVVALVLSGIVTTAGRLDAVSELLTSRYGAVVMLKVVLLASFVTAGWMQRRYVFTHVPISRGHFLAVAGLELTTMALALALAVALARTPPPG